MLVAEYAERALVAAGLLGPPQLDEIDVPVEAIANSQLREIWATITALHSEGQVIDPVIIQERVSEKAAEIINELSKLNFRISHLQKYAEDVIEAWRRRQIHSVAVSIIDNVQQDRYMAEEIASRAITELDAIANDASSTDDLISHNDALDSALKVIDNGGDLGLSTGFRSIDQFFTLNPGHFIILAARPAMGKTALADQIAENVALDGNNVLFVSMEMTAVDLAIRRISRLSGVPISTLRRGNLSPQDREYVEKAKEIVKHMGSLYILDNPTAQMHQISSMARRLKRHKGGLGLVVIDYLQLMLETASASSNPVQAMTEIARGAKVLARELEVPVIGLSQLSRSVEHRQDKRPQLSDLRESGGLEQAADVVAFIYRPAYYLENPNPIQANEAQILIRKNRQGEVGTAHMKFLAPTAQFIDG